MQAYVLDCFIYPHHVWKAASPESRLFCVGVHSIWRFPNMVVPPKSSILIGFFQYKNHPFWGALTYGNPMKPTYFLPLLSTSLRFFFEAMPGGKRLFLRNKTGLRRKICLVVWNHGILWISIHWECHHPNWRTPSFFRGVGIPPIRNGTTSHHPIPDAYCSEVLRIFGQHSICREFLAFFQGWWFAGLHEPH